jgi:hypothetical protein
LAHSSQHKPRRKRKSWQGPILLSWFDANYREFKLLF